MQSSVVRVGSQTIAVRESTGTGRPVLFVHGNSSSGTTFQRQLESPLGQELRMIAIDLPGHGQSSRADDPATQYTLAGFAQVVVDVCEQLCVADALLVGWSLGGHIVLRASTQLPRASGIMIYGTPPLGFPADIQRAFLPHPAMAAILAADLDEAEVEALVSSFSRPNARTLPDQFHTDVRRTDPRVREILAASILAAASGSRPGGTADEIDIVARLGVPLAILHGESEQLVNGAYLDTLTAPTLWRGAVQSVSDAGHAVHWEQPKKFNALLNAFARDCLPSGSAQA